MAPVFPTMVLLTLTLVSSLHSAVRRNQAIDVSGTVVEATMPDGSLHMNSTLMSIDALPQSSKHTNSTMVADWHREYKQSHPETPVKETPPVQGMPPQIAIGTAIIGFCAGGVAWSCCVRPKVSRFLALSL